MVDVLPDAQLLAVPVELLAVGHRLEQGLDRRQQQLRRLIAFELPQNAQPLAADFVEHGVGGRQANPRPGRRPNAGR